MRGNTGFVIMFYSRGDWCPFCRTWASEWQTKKEMIESKGASIVALTSQNPLKIPEAWKRTSAAFPISFDIKVKLDDNATLASKLGVVVEKPLGHVADYPNERMAQPAVFIYRVKEDSVELLVSWTHAPRAANLHGAIGRADISTLLKETFERMEAKTAVKKTKFEGPVNMRLSSFLRLFGSKFLPRSRA